ncbi:MAG: DUF1134 domain-containing protein [Nitratireductor sp.]
MTALSLKRFLPISSFTKTPYIASLFAVCALFAFTTLSPTKANAQAGAVYTIEEVVKAGHGFFGKTSGALAGALEKTFGRYGLPNGYILGEEASGAFIGGLRYGEGTLHTKNAGEHKIFWQGPSIGWDYGADGNRTMMLVYNLPDIDSIYRRYFGVSGSAYVLGGIGVTALTNKGVHLIPVRSGVGARLGVNVGYLKLRNSPRINPF